MRQQRQQQAPGPAASSAPSRQQPVVQMPGFSSVREPLDGEGAATLTFAYSSAPGLVRPGQHVLRLRPELQQAVRDARWSPTGPCPGLPAGNTLVPGTATGLGQVSSNRPGVDLPHQARGLKFEDGSPVTAQGHQVRGRADLRTGP